MKMKIWKLLKCTVCTVLFFSILINVLINTSYLFRYKEDDNSIYMMGGFYAEDENTLDVALIGSSAIYRFNVAPVMYNEQAITSYNVCSAMYPFEATVDLIKETQKTQNPKLYIIDCRRWYIRTNDIATGRDQDEEYIAHSESYLSRLVNNMPVSLERASIIHKLVPDLLPDQDEIDWQFDFLRTHNNWKTMKLSDVKSFVEKQVNPEEAREESKTEYKGALTNSGLAQYSEVDFSKYETVETAKVSKEREEVLDEVVNYVKENNLNALFITTPFPKMREDYYSYMKYLKQYFNNEKMDYIDCNEYIEDMGIDYASDFYDKKHVNTKGAVKFTKWLGNYIVDKYKLSKTELTTEQKKEWNASYTAWWSKVGKPGIEKINQKVVSLSQSK